MSELKKVLCIGLMGQIASGKSTVAAYFKELGVNVISADEIARELTAKNSLAFKSILEHFGESIKTANDDLDRKKLRTLIFKNKEQRLWLENLLHPLIRNEIETRTKAVTSQYCIIEIPLLNDRNDYPYLQRVLLIEADKELQLARCIKRDHCTEAEASAILSTQSDIKTQRSIASDVLVNNGSLCQLKEKVMAFDKALKQYIFSL